MSALITVVRHGQTAHNVGRRFQGWSEVPLNDVRLGQAEKVAARVAGLTPPVTRLYSSDLLRTRQTAEAIAAALHFPIIPAPELREIHVGEWEGLSMDEVDAQLLSAWPHVAAPGGESLAEVGARIRPFFDKVLPRQGEHVLLVSHGAALSALLCGVLGWDLQAAWTERRGHHENTALTTFELQPDGALTCQTLACARHLEERV